MLEILNDCIEHLRNTAAAPEVPVDRGQLASRGAEVAVLRLGRGARIDGAHAIGDEILDATLDVEGQLLVHLLLHGAVGDAKQPAQPGETWLVRHRLPPRPWG